MAGNPWKPGFPDQNQSKSDPGNPNIPTCSSFLTSSFTTAGPSQTSTTSPPSIFAQYSKEFTTALKFPSGILSQSSPTAYHPYRRISRTDSSRSLQPTIPGPSFSPLRSPFSFPGYSLDPRYVERRNRNNAAVRKCREKNKQLEIETCIALKKERERYHQLSQEKYLIETELRILQQLAPHCKNKPKSN